MKRGQHRQTINSSTSWLGPRLWNLTERGLPAKRFFKKSLLIVATACVYLIVARISPSSVLADRVENPISFSTGVGLASLLLIDEQVWPSILIGSSAAGLLVSRSPGATVLMAIGESVSVLSAALLVRRFVTRSSPLHRSRDALKLISLAGLLCPIVLTITYTASLWMRPAEMSPGIGVLVLIRWLSACSGIVLVAPSVLAWVERPSSILTPLRWFEALLLFAALTVVSVTVLGGFLQVTAETYLLACSMIFLVIWAAARFGLRGSSSAAMIVSIVSTWYATRGFGPFVEGNSNYSMVWLQTFVLFIAIAALLLGSCFREQHDALNNAMFLGSIADSTADAVIGTSPDGIVVSWNQGAEEVFGFEPSEIIGQPISVLSPPDRTEDLDLSMQRIGRGESIARMDTVRLRKDGRRVHTALTVSPICDSTGKVIGGATIARNINDQKRTEAEMDRLLERERAIRKEAEEARRLSVELLVREKSMRIDAETSNRSKHEFLALVSHELRTPLNAILGWVNILLTNNDEGLKAQGLEVIRRNARLQVRVLEDILDLSRVIAGKLKLENQETELHPIIQAVMIAAIPSAKEKGVRLLSSLEGEVDPIIGDSRRLHQIVWNLVSNAIKFTHRGGEVKLSLSQIDSAVQISVRDNGEGISPESLPHIFDRFRQGLISSTGNHSGLRLGLAISRKLVELHNGKIVAGSDGLKLGSTFTVVLPSVRRRYDFMLDATKDDSESVAVSSGADSRTLSAVRVLLVDDDPDSLDMLTTALGLKGAVVRTASTVREALKLFETWKPDALVSDIGMPDVDGYTLIKEVRAREVSNSELVPAIALTGYATQQEAEKIIASGYQIHLAKPVELQRLISTIFELTRSRAEGAI